MQENLTRDAPEIDITKMQEGVSPADPRTRGTMYADGVMLTKECKFCGSMISENAIKCVHCLEYTDIKYKWKGVVVKPALFQKVFCTHCLQTSKPRTITKGSLLIEMIMWLAIIPGLFYSSYRQKSKTCVCRLCGSDRINKL